MKANVPNESPTNVPVPNEAPTRGSVPNDAPTNLSVPNDAPTTRSSKTAALPQRKTTGAEASLPKLIHASTTSHPRNMRPYYGQKLGVDGPNGIVEIPKELLSLAIVGGDRILDGGPWTGTPIYER